MYKKQLNKQTLLIFMEISIKWQVMMTSITKSMRITLFGPFKKIGEVRSFVELLKQNQK